MAHNSVSPQTANLKDGENESNVVDLEEGEIEDGELPEEEGVTNVLVPVCETESGTETTVQPPEKVEKANVPVSTRSGSKRRQGQRLHHHRVERSRDAASEAEADDEWAGVVEKAIKAAMSKDNSSDKIEGVHVSNSDKQPSEEEKKYKRKKRKKKHREDDDEENKKESKRRKRFHHWNAEEHAEGFHDEKGGGGGGEGEGEEEEDDDDNDDDDEMLFIRGASPVMKNSYLDDESPPSASFLEDTYSFSEQGLVYDDAYDSYNEEESDYESREDFLRGSTSICDDDVPKRGLGRGVKRRQRGIGRGIQNKRQGRKDNKSKRGGSKRQQQIRSHQEHGSESLCMFYMQGKCQKGDDCPYSHDASPPRKLELCKFYLINCCAKKDKCLYMHHDFPCKFYHTGMKCFSGTRCKFSHGHLTDTMRAILLKHLETAPKEILGDFPRLSREGAAAMVFNKKNRGNKANKKIPSLFDIEVPIPAQLLAEQKEAGDDQSPSRRTPMPESDNEEQERVSTPMPASPKRSENRSPSRVKGQRWSNEGVSFPHASHSRDSREEHESDRKATLYERDFSKQLDEFKPLLRYYQETLSSDEGEKRREENFKKETRQKRELNLHRLAGYSPNPTTSDDGKQKSLSIVEDLSMEVVDEGRERIVKLKDIDMKEEKKPQSESTTDSHRDSQADTGDSGTESNDGTNIPLHLPKKQRELFLRIQQQQREADSSQDRSGDNDDADDNPQEVNWYSSDEEDESLTDVLKNLSQQEQKNYHSKQTTAPVPTVTTTAATTTTTAARTTASSSGNFDKLKLADLSQIDISESVSKLLSSICNKQNKEEPGTQLPTSTAEGTPAPPPPPPPPPPHPSNPTVARDPRLSRDPRNRSAVGTVASAGVPLETNLPAFATTIVTTSISTYVTASGLSISSPSSHEPHRARRSDPRRINDPRSVKSNHRSETSDHRHHGSGAGGRRSSTSGATSTFTSIYSNAITSSGLNSDISSSLSVRLGLNLTARTDPGGADIDLRTILTGKDMDNTDIDLRRDGKSDLDLRPVQRTSFTYGDTDLRPKSQDLMGVGQILEGGKSGSDIDLRRVLELPFKPVPMHTPATEIDASLTSHPPIPYKVVVVTIPRPDYTNLKVNTDDPQVHSDPRLRKIFKIGSAPALSPTKNLSPSLSSSRIDPRRQTVRSASGSGTNSDFRVGVNMVPEMCALSATASTGSKPQNEILMLPNTLMMQGPGMLTNMALPQNPALANFDPRIARNPRNAPGILGPAPLPANYCPNTPHFEDQEENSDGSDNDPRMYYNRGNNSVDSTVWEQQNIRHRQQHSQRSSWRSAQRNQQQRYMDNDFSKGSYTPPI